MTCLQKLFFGLIVAGSVGLIPTQAMAQFGGGPFDNTPFDPDTWDPSDWVKGPEIESRSVRRDRVRINNVSSKSAWACIGNTSVILGWFEIKPGQNFEYYLPPNSSHVLKMLVHREGKTIHWDKAKPFIGHSNTPYHPKKAFELKRENDNWRLVIEQRNLGVYNNEGLEDHGVRWKKFEKFRIEGNDIGFNIE